MEVEEPSEKVETANARGECEPKTINETPKQVIKNGDQEEEEKEENSKAEPKRTRVKYSYSLEDLNGFKDSPASQAWPAFIEEDCIKNGVWDPELWHHTPASAKRCASPVDDIKRQIIKEDGIVLSPQRQSFGQGCHVPQSAPERGLQQERTKNMLSRTLERDPRDGRNRLTGRVGRGSRSMDYRVNPRERPTRNGDLRQTSPWERDRNDKDYKRTKEEDGYSYKKGKKRYENIEPEPEWMTYGPTSQLETIELGGFDREEMFGKRSKTGSFTGSDDAPKANKKEKVENKNKKNKETLDDQEEGKDEKDFDINQFFVSDAFSQFSDVLEKSNSNASRFCQFFGVDERKDGSRRSSAAEELLEYSGLSSASPSTPRTPSPNQGFMFTPIKPVDASTEPENLAEMLEKTKIDMKPLLETVMSSGKTDKERVKGQIRLEDIEKTVENDKQGEEPVKQEDSQKKDNDGQDMSAFFKLVETMATSGNLPEKPQPVIPGLPSRLLPRPPSPKANRPSRTPSPQQKFRTSPSPTEILQHMMQGHQIPSPSAIPSPPQVVPQLDRPYSPYGTPVHRSLEMLRRSPSPLSSMYDQPKSFSPLLTPDAFMMSSVMHPYLPMRGSPSRQYIDKPHFELPNEQPEKPSYRTPRPMSNPNNTGSVKTMQKSQTSALKDLAFMPTSVLQKIKKDQMTPKSKTDTDESKKDKIENGVKDSSRNVAADKNTKQSVLPSSSRVPEQYPPGKEEIKSMFQPFSHEATLLKPTAFKPYSGMSPGSVSPLRSGIHSEPHSPVASRTSASPSQNRLPMTSSAPVTPQRPPHAEHHLMSNQQLHFHHLRNGPTSRADEFQGNERAIKSVMQEKRSLGNIPVKVPDEIFHLRMQKEKSDRHTRQDHEQQRQLQQAIQQHQQQQQKQTLGNIDRGIANSHEGNVPDELFHLRMQKEISDRHARQDHEQQRQLQQAIQQHQQQQQKQSLGNVDRGIANSHEGKVPDELFHLRMQKEMSDRRQDHEQQRQLQQAIQQHQQQQQQQLRREIHNLNQMYRNRPTPPHMMGGRVSPSTLRSPGLPRTPYNTPLQNMHPQGKQGVHPAMMRSPVPSPYLRMMPPRNPSMPMPSQAAVMQMMQQHPSMMYGPGHTPMPGHHGYGPMNPPMVPPASNYPVPRHPGLMHHQGKVPSNMPQHQDPNPRGSPSDNVLAKWFSEDILRSAQGKTPSVHDKKVMSVEDLERQQAMFAAMT